jgi:hypothetical protein
VYLFEHWIGIFCRGPDGGVKDEVLGAGSFILIPPVDLPMVFLAFFWGVGLAVAFYLIARVFRALASALAEGLIINSSPRGQAKTRIAGTEISPSKPGT